MGWRWNKGVKWGRWCSYRWRPWPQRLPSRRRKASTRGSPQKTCSHFSQGDKATRQTIVSLGIALSHRHLWTPENSVRGRKRSCQRERQCRRGKWRNGKCHMIDHLGRIQLCWRGCAWQQHSIISNCWCVVSRKLHSYIIIVCYTFSKRLYFVGICDIASIYILYSLYCGMFCCKCTDCSWNASRHWTLAY